MSAVLWPRSGSFEFTAAGTPATGAKAYFYDAGTSTPRAVYQDATLSTPHLHPVVADGNGRWPAIYLPFGDYKYTLTTSGGTTLISIDNIANDEPTDPGAGVDANAIFQTGDTIITFKNGTRTGFVRCNGRTIGSAASGATERANADCSALFEFIYGACADAQAPVSGGRGANAAADFAANKTITLPNGRGAGLIGFDDMGNSAAGLLGSAPVVSGSGILAGSLLGANTHTLATSEAPAHTHSVSITTDSQGAHTHTATTSSDGAHTHTVNVTDPGHLHQINVATQGNIQTGGATSVVLGNAPWAVSSHGVAGESNTSTTGITAATVSNGAHTHTLTTTSNGAHTHSVSGTSGSTGGGGAHNILSRSIPVTVLMKL